jgi:hypothetical protein
VRWGPGRLGIRAASLGRRAWQGRGLAPRHVHAPRGLLGYLPEARLGVCARLTPAPGAHARPSGRPWYGGTVAGRHAVGDAWQHALGDVARRSRSRAQLFSLPSFECV